MSTDQSRKLETIKIMINIKVKNILKLTHVCKENCVKKCQSLIQFTGAEAYVKPTLGMHILQSLQGQFSSFHFLILFLKTLKLSKYF